MSIRDRYILDARLGIGGMAEVFRARRVGVNDFTRGVAVKRMIGGRAASTEFQQMFATEARITSQLIHPNIVSVLDFDRDDDGTLCLVMELVEGCDLSRLAKTGLLPFEVVTYLIIEALKGLGHAHRFTREGIKGVVHRDVSPHNLLLSWQGEVKVSDFGLAKVWSGDAATATEGLKGKPAYMSPEQANSQPLDGRSDLFAVGTMMWELLIGRPLFGADDARASLAAILFGTVPPPRQLRPDVPRDLERVVIKLLQREPGKRYKTADEAIVDLLDCQVANGDGRNQLASTLAARFGRQVPVLAPIQRRTEQATRARRGRILPFVVLGLVASTALTAWLVVPHRRTEPERPTPPSTEKHVALIDDTSTFSPAFQYPLDAKELPPSCLLLLNWLYNSARSRLLPETSRAHAGDELTHLHDGLAGEVSEGVPFAFLDSECREATKFNKGDKQYAAQPLPILDDWQAMGTFQHSSYWNTFQSATVKSSTGPRHPPASTSEP